MTEYVDALNELNDARMMRLEANGRVLLAVRAARAAGLSWATIGRALDMSKQAAQQRYAHLITPLPTPQTVKVAFYDGGENARSRGV